jgi:hypothetical protein
MDPGTPAVARTSPSLLRRRGARRSRRSKAPLCSPTGKLWRGSRRPCSSAKKRRLFASFEGPDGLIARRDRAILAVMLYGFVRVGALVRMRVRDFQTHDASSCFSPRRGDRNHCPESLSIARQCSVSSSVAAATWGCPLRSATTPFGQPASRFTRRTAATSKQLHDSRAMPTPGRLNSTTAIGGPSALSRWSASSSEVPGR